MNTAREKEEKKYVSFYLPVETADRLKDVTDAGEIEKEIVNYIEKTKEEFRNELACFDDDILMFRGQLVKAKHSFKDAYEEYRAANYGVWETFQDDVRKAKDFVAEAEKTLKPVAAAFQEIEALMKAFHKWDLEALLKLMNELNSSSTNTKEMIRYLMENFKREAA